MALAAGCVQDLARNLLCLMQNSNAIGVDASILLQCFIGSVYILNSSKTSVKVLSLYAKLLILMQVSTSI